MIRICRSSHGFCKNMQISTNPIVFVVDFEKSIMCADTRFITRKNNFLRVLDLIVHGDFLGSARRRTHAEF